MKTLTTLPEFILKTGVKQVAMAMKVHNSAVYDWLNLDVAPNYKNAHRLVKLSKGKLSYDSIYIPFFAKNKIV